MYVFGPGATGKSMFGITLSAILPSDQVTISSMRSLNRNEFEVINLSNKALVIMNDIDDYSGDLNILKAFVGGDMLQGSIKYVQGSFKVRPAGLLLVLANHAFASRRDAGGALARRILPIPARNISKERTPLLAATSDGTFTGILAPELPGILN